MHNLYLLQLIFTNSKVLFKSRLVLVIAHPRIQYIMQTLVTLFRDKVQIVLIQMNSNIRIVIEGRSYLNYKFKDTKSHRSA